MKSSRKKTDNKKEQKPLRRRGMWKGYIAFGLVNIPIYLESATQVKKIRFNLIDKHDHAPIGYKQIQLKIKHGDTARVEKIESPEAIEAADNVIDLTALLKKSLDTTKKRSARGS